MHGLKEILKMVEKNCFMASLDIKDAYYSIPVYKIYMERTTMSVRCPPKWTFTMSQMVYKAIETTISRAEEIKT